MHCRRQKESCYWLFERHLGHQTEALPGGRIRNVLSLTNKVTSFHRHNAVFVQTKNGFKKKQSNNNKTKTAEIWVPRYKSQPSPFPAKSQEVLCLEALFCREVEGIPFREVAGIFFGEMAADFFVVEPQHAYLISFACEKRSHGEVAINIYGEVVQGPISTRVYFYVANQRVP